MAATQGASTVPSPRIPTEANKTVRSNQGHIWERAELWVGEFGEFQRATVIDSYTRLRVDVTVIWELPSFGPLFRYQITGDMILRLPNH